ncbi:MAG: isoaspartyl peptidase/L-asparaginase [Cyanobacteria bacterium P01_A01_bin.37]
MSQVQPKLIIHGGAGSSLQGKGGVETVRALLSSMVASVYHQLKQGATAEDAVIAGCQILEDEPRFNAGTGSVLQSDGQVRMSASLMNGATQQFSGVINVSRVKNPIQLAKFLQTSPDRVLSDHGSAALLRELQIPDHNPLTDKRLKEWLEERTGNFQRSMANVISEDAAPTESEVGRGTIGVVALDDHGRIAVGTSTGGKGFERVGRVSDSAMPAGNYATQYSGVSCTGIGEDIIDECLAARIVIRVTDGATLHDAFMRSLTESANNNRDLGAIGLSHTGAIAWGKTSEVLLAAYHNGDAIGDTLELDAGLQVGTC